jgi:hypothetical protein
MKGLCVAAVIALAASLAGAAGATTRSPSGDTCTATGTGTAYTLNITIPSGTPQQFGFAFGAAGTAVTNIDVPGSDGTFSSQNVPSSTTGAWVTLSPLMPGSAVASLTTRAPVTGAFRVVPASSTQSTFLDPITCTLSPSLTPVPSSAFTVNHHVTYDSKAHGWHLGVAISGRGTVSALQLEPTVGTTSSKSLTAKSLVQARNAGLKSRGTVTLLLKPTALGSKTLAAKGSISVKLSVIFAPTGGKSATKVVSLNLKR